MNNFWLERKESSITKAMDSWKTAIEKSKPIEVFYSGESVGKTKNICFFKDHITAEVEISKKVMDYIQQPTRLFDL